MSRIVAILEDPSFLAYMDRIRAREAKRRFCCHNFQHFMDVARITYILMLENGQIHDFMEEHDLTFKLARELIYASALLHDIGRWKQYETGEDHAAAGAQLAEEILALNGFSPGEIAIVTAAIREHRRQSGDKTILGRNIFMGDKLSRNCEQCHARAECNKYEKMLGIRQGRYY